MKIQAAVCSLQNDDDSNSEGKELNMLYNNVLNSAQEIEFTLKAGARKYGCSYDSTFIYADEKWESCYSKRYYPAACTCN